MWQRLCKSPKKNYSQKPSQAISQDQRALCKIGGEKLKYDTLKEAIYQTIKQGITRLQKSSQVENLFWQSLCCSVCLQNSWSGLGNKITVSESDRSLKLSLGVIT